MKLFKKFGFIHIIIIVVVFVIIGLITPPSFLKQQICMFLVYGLVGYATLCMSLFMFVVIPYVVYKLTIQLLIYLGLKKQVKSVNTIPMSKNPELEYEPTNASPLKNNKNIRTVSEEEYQEAKRQLKKRGYFNEN